MYKPEKKSKIGYITILDNNGKNVWDKIKNLYKYFFNKIDIENAANNKIFKIPSQIYNKMNFKKIKMVINKINKEISNSEIDAIVLCKKTKEMIHQYTLGNTVQNTVFFVPILNGKFLMKNLSINILNKILEYQNTSVSLAKIYVLVEKYNKENNDIIYDLSNKVKNINIVTNNIKSFKKIEDKLFTNTGVAVTVANNKKKSLRKADLIVNLDFNNELIKNYNINRTAIIINCTCEDLKMENGFSGVIINKVQYEKNTQMMEYFRIYNLLEKFELSELYESLIFNKSYDKIQKQNSEYNLLISSFIGGRGQITVSEIKALSVQTTKNNVNYLTNV